MEHCKGCRFWLNWDTEDTNLGECHRFPPQMVTVRLRFWRTCCRCSSSRRIWRFAFCRSRFSVPTGVAA